MQVSTESEFLSWLYCRKIIFNLCRLVLKFLSDCTNNDKESGLMTRTGCLEKQERAFQGTLGRR